MSEFSSLDATKWHVFPTRKRRPFMVDFWTYDLAHPSIDIGFDYQLKHVGHYRDKVLIDLASFTAQKVALQRELEHKPWFLKRLLDAARRHFDEILWPYFHHLPTHPASNPSELARTLEEFRSQMSQYCAYIILPLYVEDELTEQVRAGLERSDATGRLFEVATTMVEEGLIASEQRRIVELATRSEDEVKRSMPELLESFAWMSNQLYWMDFHDESYYRARIADARSLDPLAQLKAMDQSLSVRREAYQKVLDKLEQYDQLRAAVETLQSAIWFRNFRGERLYQSSWYLRPTLRAVAAWAGLTERDIVWWTIPELCAALRGEIHLDPAVIDERKRGFALLTNVNNDHVVAGADLDVLDRAMQFETTSESELRGQTAFPGVVSVSVFVVHDLSDLARVPDGSILVTHATTPAFVPVLRKVAAVITEEGGVLSHAAMIARELKIPTIIGIKNATKQIKTGEIVVANADRGTVLKVE